MTTGEFSSEFDILYNNIMSNKAPGIDDYEKSVFLTKAQLEIVLNHFNPKGNKYQEGMDESIKRQVEFSELIAVGTNSSTATNPTPFDKRGVVFDLPADLLLILNEFFIVAEIISQGEGGTPVTGDKTFRVLPISFDEYFRLMSKPYKAPLKGQVWRLLKSSEAGTQVEIIPYTGLANWPTSIYGVTYDIRYVKRPTPIVLMDLTDMNATIEGVSTVTECALNPLIHRQILDRAVELAKLAYTGDLQTTVQLNTRNE